MKKPIRDLCIARVPKKNLIMDPDHKAMPFEDWIAGVPLDPQIKHTACTIFNSLVRGGLLVPWVAVHNNGVRFCFDNDSKSQRRLLYIEVEPGKSVRYQVTLEAINNGDHAWQFITDSDLIVQTFKHLTRYILGEYHATAASA